MKNIQIFFMVLPYYLVIIFHIKEIVSPEIC